MGDAVNTPNGCVARATDWFAHLTQASLGSIGEIYARDAHFKDPFNDVTGIDRIQAIYAHMFENLTDPRFEITLTIEQADAIVGSDWGDKEHERHVLAFVAWQFKFEWRGQKFDIPGGTRFVFNQEGLIADHVDYWDVAQGLYERLPLIGAVLRMLRQRMATPAS